MVTLQQALRDGATEDFWQSLKAELLALEPGILPLQQGVTQGGYADASNLEMTLLDKSETSQQIIAKVGLFYGEIIAGCSCGDDPVVDSVYCEVRIRIDRETAEAQFDLVDV
ncbi:glucosamine--fructose-6-phosphate aminotransferase [Sedimenticola sp.]|uniref:glucosamine--fructose-6-phosphate aminotransferase n=2 Tax=Sedimenticola sp. TaxID=1940285 RepID=UPI003D0A616C